MMVKKPQMISRLRLRFAGFLRLFLSFTGLIQAAVISNEGETEAPKVTLETMPLLSVVASVLWLYNISTKAQ